VVVLLGLGLGSRTRPAAAQPGHLSQQLRRAETAYRAGRFDEAVWRFDRLIRRHPKEVPPTAYAYRASIFVMRRGYDEGLHWIRTVAEPVYPDDPFLLEQKALLLYARTEYRAEAIATAERVVARRRDAYPLYLMLGDHYLAQGPDQAARSAAAYRVFLRGRPAALAHFDQVTEVKLGLALNLGGRHAEAERQLARALRLPGPEPVRGHARHGLCEALALQGKWPAALPPCEQAARARLDPPRPEAWLYLARARHGLGRREPARQAVLRYLAAAPRRPEGHILLGELLVEGRQLEAASRSFRTAAQLDPRSPVAVARLGRLFLDGPSPAPAEAVRWLERAAQRAPRHPLVQLHLGRAYLASGDPRRAAGAAQALRKLAGADAELRARGDSLLGSAQLALGGLRAASGAFRRALDQMPALEEARLGLASTLTRDAVARLDAGDPAGAEPLLLEAARLAPAHPDARLDLGLLYLDGHRDAEAVTQLRAHLEQRPDDPVAHRALARALLRAGATETALDHLARAALHADSAALRTEVATERALVLLRAGRLEEAIASAPPAGTGGEAARVHLLARCLRAVSALEAGDPRRAAASFHDAGDPDATPLGPHDRVCRAARALAAVTAGQRDGLRLLTSLYQDADRSWLAPPFRDVGAALLLAHAHLRSGSDAGLEQADRLLAGILRKSPPAAQDRVRSQARATAERLALSQVRRGQLGPAAASLGRAEALADSEDARTGIAHNRAVVALLRGDERGARSGFQSVAERVPEALANLGLLHDRNEQAEKAYELWLEARRRGLQHPQLQQWIELKERFFGFAPGGP
jgi:tetratricopeptide (TPR) repeat protein